MGSVEVASDLDLLEYCMFLRLRVKPYFPCRWHLHF